MLNIKKNMGNYKLMSNIFSSRGNTQYDSFGSNLNQDHDDYFYMLGITNYINSDILDVKYTKSQNKITQSAPAATDSSHHTPPNFLSHVPGTRNPSHQITHNYPSVSISSHAQSFPKAP